MKNKDLGAFLQAARARLRPADVGLPSSGRRRVPGLRRGEVAQLAGISVEYYQRLEQGRAIASTQVLDALSRALRLGEVERQHMYILSGSHPGPKQQRVSSDVARPALHQTVAALPIPALIVNDRFDVLGANHMARKLFPDVPNLARFLFLDPYSEELYVEWAAVAAATVGQLRAVTAQYPRDRNLAQLVAELQAGSPIFADLWGRGNVDQRTYGTKLLRHPELGVLALRYENLAVVGEPRQRLVTFTPEPGTPSEAALQLLRHEPSRAT